MTTTISIGLSLNLIAFLLLTKSINVFHRNIDLQSMATSISI
jgi:hypothetical protein